MKFVIATSSQMCRVQCDDVWGLEARTNRANDAWFIERLPEQDQPAVARGPWHEVNDEWAGLVEWLGRVPEE